MYFLYNLLWDITELIIFIVVCLATYFLSPVIGIFGFLLFVVFIVLSKLFYGRIRGAKGEFVTKFVLKGLAKKTGYVALHDILLETEPEYYTQIDHLFFTDAGIFVIEGKNYYGHITGDCAMDEWQRFNKAGIKRTTKNPVKQNAGHLKAYRKIFDISAPLYNVVVFGIDADLGRVTNAYDNVLVLPIKKLKSAIMQTVRKNKGIVDAEYLRDITAETRKMNITDKAARRQHIKNCKNKDTNIYYAS